MKARKQVKSMFRPGKEAPLQENDPVLFENWKVVDQDDAGVPTVIQVEDHDTISLRERSGKVARVGAIPFELHQSFNPTDDTETRGMDKDDINRFSSEHTIDLNINRQTSLVKTEEKKVESVDDFDADTSIIVYMDDTQPSSNILELYLYEKKVQFVKTQISRKTKNHLTSEFLEINPEGTLPTMLYDKNTLKTGSMKIIHFIEENFPVNQYPALIPCTIPPILHQKFLYFSSQLDDIDMTALEIGSNLHRNHVSLNKTDIEEEIEEMIHLSGIFIILIINYYKSKLSSDIFAGADDILEPYLLKTIEASRKTLLTGADNYQALLNRVQQVFERSETEFAETRSPWLLGSTFTAVDVQLGVLIYHLEKVDQLEHLWAGKQYLHNFWNNFKARTSVRKILFSSRKKLDSRQETNESGGAREEDSTLETAKTGNTFTSDIHSSEEDAELNKRREDRTWYNLW